MIIIPVYNTLPYLNECMQSVLNQKTSYTFHVTVVDDGSNDGSGKFLEKYADNPKVEIIHQENKGVAAARNRGLLSIKGKYIMFIDSDDVLLPGAIHSLVHTAFSLNADIVEGGCISFDNYGKILQRIQYADTTSAIGSFKRRGQPWGKVIRSELFRYLQFPAGYEFEDSIFAYCIYPAAKRKYNIGDMVYGYRYNEASITHTVSRSVKAIDTYYVSLHLWDYYAKHFVCDAAFNEQVIRQIVLNYNRTKALGIDVLQYGFCAQKDKYMNLFSEQNELQGKYGKLDVCIRKSNYKGYDLICRRWSYL